MISVMEVQPGTTSPEKYDFRAEMLNSTAKANETRLNTADRRKGTGLAAVTPHAAKAAILWKGYFVVPAPRGLRA